MRLVHVIDRPHRSCEPPHRNRPTSCMKAVLAPSCIEAASDLIAIDRPHESCASAPIEAASDLIAIDRPHKSCASALIEAASDLIATFTDLM